MAKKKAVRRVTAVEIERLSRLAEILEDFLPLTAFSKQTVTYTSIFAKSSVERYLNTSGSKKQKLEYGFTKLYRDHKSLPSIIIRKVVPASVAYRKHMRNPLTRKELDQLSECLFDLEIDMRSELSRVVLDESLPPITIPPEKLKEHLRQHDLHPLILSEPYQLFEDGHFNEAVRKVGERFEDKVREISGMESSGRDLMSKAFADGRCLNLNGLEKENHDSFIVGYKFLAMGAMAAIRNVFSHGDEESRSPEECYEMLLFFNLMFRWLKDSSSNNSD